MSDFQTQGLKEALLSSGGGQDQVDPASLGWTKPEPFDYKRATGADEGIEASIQNDPNEQAWAHNAKKYEWKDEYGDVGPEIPALENELFHNEFVTRSGTQFNRLLNVKVIAEAAEKPAPIRNFKSAGLHPIMESNIEKCGYDIPTPIQAYTVPAVMQGHDIIATAQTGSGKTAAFLIPTISKLMGKVKKLAAPRPDVSGERGVNVRAEPLILVVAPTRELCCQIFDEARRLCYRSMLRPCVVYGGAPIREQRDELRKGCDVLIATPGRLIDFMQDTRLLSMQRLRFTVIDEADEMLHEDWEEEMGKIMSGADANEDGGHQYLLFSATFNKRMRKLAKQYLANDHVRVRIGRSGAVLNSVTQRIHYVQGNLKQQALFDLLMDMPPARTIVFVKSKKTADFVDDFLFNKGLPSTSIHSDRMQREREDAIRAFRAGTCPILVTTGVSARGIDVKNVMHIVNFDLPSADHNGEDEYIHRIGRTARIGNEGLATSFYNDDNEPLAAFLAKTLVECGQEVPDFLESYKPQTADNIEWNDDSDMEDDDTAAVANGNTWGSDNNADGFDRGDTGNAWGGNGNVVAASTIADGWGASNATSAGPSAW